MREMFSRWLMYVSTCFLFISKLHRWKIVFCKCFTAIFYGTFFFQNVFLYTYFNTYEVDFCEHRSFLLWDIWQKKYEVLSDIGCGCMWACVRVYGYCYDWLPHPYFIIFLLKRNYEIKFIIYDREVNYLAIVAFDIDWLRKSL